jgi:predicted PurR-regulated permease PerM
MVPRDASRDRAFVVATTLLVALAGWMVLPFVGALLWAIVLTILTAPLMGRLQRRLSRRIGEERGGTLAALAVVVGTLLILLLPFLIIGGALIAQANGLVHDMQGESVLSIQSVLTRLDEGLHPIMQRLGASEFSLAEYFGQNRREILDGLRQPLTNLIRSGATGGLTVVIALLSQFFLLRDGKRLEGPAVDLSPLPPDQTRALFAKIADTVHAVFVGTVLVALLQGIIIGFAFAWAGMPNALLLGAVSAVLCVLPLLGAPVVYLPVGLYLLSQGDTAGALKVLLIGGLVVSQVDNLIKPVVIGGRTNLHPLAVFFSILGGVFVFGPVGVFAGPMVLAALLFVLEVARQRATSGDAATSAVPEV